MLHPIATLKENTLIVIPGPTAVGKTDLCIWLAGIFGTEIISADSRQFYRELKIGSAIPSEEQLAVVPHHFIGFLSVTDYYNVFLYQKQVLAKLAELFRDHECVIMTGGSGLYIQATCCGLDDFPDIDAELRQTLKTKFEQEGIESLRNELKMLDPVFYDEVDLHNPARMIRALEICIQTGRPYSLLRLQKKAERNFRILRLGLNRPREELFERIEHRVDEMLEKGLLGEVQSLIPHRELTPLKTVGYREVFEYIDGKYSLDEAIAKIKANTRRYAKKQLTWFRRDDDIIWFHPEEKTRILKFISAFGVRA